MKVPSKHGLERKFKPWRKGKSVKSNKRSSLKQQLRGLERLLAKVDNNDNGNVNDNTKSDNDGDDQRQKKDELKSKIKSLKQEIHNRQHQIQCKKHADKSHGQRFMDRQKLTRQEKQLRKKMEVRHSSDSDDGDGDDEEQELFLLKTALDQVYVAHHPTDVKYMPLFKKGQRVVDQSRQLYRRAVTRKRILKGLQVGSSIKTAASAPASASSTGDRWERVSWISSDQYERLPSDWMIQDEERVFGGSISRSATAPASAADADADANCKDGTRKKQQRQQASIVDIHDSRFAMQSTHEAMIQAAEQLEAKLDEEEKEETVEKEDNIETDQGQKSNTQQNMMSKQTDARGIKRKQDDSDGSDSGSNSSSSDSDDGDRNKYKDEADPLVRSQDTSSKHPQKHSSTAGDEGKDKEDVANDSSCSSSSSSDSSSDNDSSSDHDDDDDKEGDTKPASSAEKIGTKEEKVTTDDNDKEEEEDDSEDGVDDFLMDEDDENVGGGGVGGVDSTTNVFEMSAVAQIPEWGEARGDKSRGWETQRQRPGEFKQKRTRR